MCLRATLERNSTTAKEQAMYASVLWAACRHFVAAATTQLMRQRPPGDATNKQLGRPEPTTASLVLATTAVHQPNDQNVVQCVYAMQGDNNLGLSTFNLWCTTLVAAVGAWHQQQVRPLDAAAPSTIHACGAASLPLPTRARAYTIQQFCYEQQQLQELAHGLKQQCWGLCAGWLQVFKPESKPGTQGVSRWLVADSLTRPLAASMRQCGASPHAGKTLARKES